VVKQKGLENEKKKKKKRRKKEGGMDYDYVYMKRKPVGIWGH
jgi:hypothetical protein